MLKLTSEIPKGQIDGINKIYKTSKYIGRISSVLVDGVKKTLKDFTYNNNILTFNIAPTTSITVDYFYRDLEPIEGSGEVRLYDLKRGFYKKIGRIKENGEIPENINRLYPEKYVEEEIRKSYYRLFEKSPIRRNIQNYSIYTTNNFPSTGSLMNKIISYDESLILPMTGMFMVDGGAIYDYYGYDNNGIKVKDDLYYEVNSEILFGYKVPVGVSKIVQVTVNGSEYGYVDEMSFKRKGGEYTIVTNPDGEDFLFIPYINGDLVINVKYTSEPAYLEEDEDIVNIPYGYMDVIVLDVAYRLLQEKEDERWQLFKMELGDGKKTGLLAEYQKTIKGFTKDEKAKIGFAPTYKYKKRR